MDPYHMEKINELWGWSISFFNSDFMVALLGAMAGAYFGASAAQKVILK